MNTQNDWNALIGGVSEGQVPSGDSMHCFTVGEQGSRPKSKLYFCVPWPGVYLWANQIGDRYLPYDGSVQRHFATLNYCLSGRCEVCLPDGTYIYMEPGMLCLDNHEPKDGYAYPTRQYEGLEIAFDLELLREAPPDALLAYGRFGESIEALLTEHNGSCLASVTDACKEKIQGLFVTLRTQTTAMEDIRFFALSLLWELKNGSMSILSEASFVTRGQRRIVTEIEERLTADLSHRYTVSDLAAEYGISPSALKKYFEEVFGLPISHYLRQKRMALAKTLLSETRQSVSEIANQCGYTHQGKFGSAFRESEGMSPLEYRRINFRKRGTEE